MVPLSKIIVSNTTTEKATIQNLDIHFHEVIVVNSRQINPAPRVGVKPINAYSRAYDFYIVCTPHVYEFTNRLGYCGLGGKLVMAIVCSCPHSLITISRVKPWWFFARQTSRQQWNWQCIVIGGRGPRRRCSPLGRM